MTSIVDLPYFGKAHSKKHTYKECPPEVVQKYRGRLPDILIETWTAFGFQEFSNGFLWSVNPDEFRDVIADFLYSDQIDLANVVFRSGLGDMIVSYEGSLVHFSAVTMRHAKMAGTLESILEMDLSHPQSLSSIFFYNMYKSALKKLGKPSEDEMFGLVPAPAIGGEIRADNLQKVNLRIYMNYLAQLQPRPEAPASA